MFSLLERKYQNTSFIRRLLEPRNSRKPECFYPWIRDISLHLSHSCGKYHTGITMYLFKWQSLVVLSRIIPPEHSFSLQSWIFLACFTVVVGLLLVFFAKHAYKTKDRVTWTPLKTRGELTCSERVSSSCSTSDTRRGNLVTNPVISHEWGKDQEVLRTSGTYPWLFVTQIFHNGQPSHGGDGKTLEVMTSS